MDANRQRIRELRDAAAAKYRPDAIDLLLVAEAPPDADDRYFYFEDVSTNDWLFRGVAAILLGEQPNRTDKAKALSELKERGVFLVDLKLDPIDGSDLACCVDDLVKRCKVLMPRKVVLIKATVYDVAYKALRRAGLPVIGKRVFFPSTGRQNDFRRQFREALRMVADGER